MADTYTNKLFVSGYLRQFQLTHALHDVIPSELCELIMHYFPKRYNIYGVGKTDFDEFGLNSEVHTLSRYTKLPLFSSILCNTMDIQNSYRTFILRDYNNTLYYFGHINKSLLKGNHHPTTCRDLKVISQGIMAKISVIQCDDTLIIHQHETSSNQESTQRIHNIGMIFKAKVIKISCLMHEAIYLTAAGQIFYALHTVSSTSGVPNMMSASNDISVVPQHITVLNNDGDNVFITDVACGSWHTLLLSENGDVYGFGKNMFGQLGFGTQVQYLLIRRPTLHPFFKDLKFKHIRCGALFSMFITENGLCYLCGDNDEGQIGNGIRKTDVKVPFALDTDVLGKIVNGDCGNKHCVVLNEHNDIWCLGENAYGQCIPYLDGQCFDRPKQLLKADIGCEDYHVIERVITGVDVTLFIVCP
eukprot:73275_1